MLETLPLLNLGQSLAKLVQRASELIPFQAGGMLIYDSVARRLAPLIYEPAPPPTIDFMGGAAGIAVQSGRAVQQAATHYTEAAAPMILQGRVMGVFVARTGSDGYTPAHLKILETLADQAALLFNTSQLYTILARRYERLSNYNDELYLRNEVSRLASSDLPSEEVLPKMLQFLTQLVSADAAAIVLWDAAEERPIRLSAYGLDLGDFLSEKRRPFGVPSLTESIIKTHDTVIINNAQRHPNPPSPLIVEYEAHALMAMPLVARGRAIGAVFLLNLIPDRPFEQEHARQAASILDQIALAIDNRSLLRTMQDRLSETAALLEIAALAASSLHADEMFGTVLKVSREMLGVTCGAFFLYDRHQNRLVLHPSGYFGMPESLAGAAFPVNVPGNHMAIVFSSGTPYYANDVRKATQDTNSAYTQLLMQLNLTNILLAPLRVQDEPMGIFMVGNKRGDFTRADAQLLMAMGSHVAAALRSTELLTDTRDRLRETESLKHIAEITASTLDLDEMLERALQETAEMLDAEGAILFMPNPEQTALVPHQRSRFGIAQDLPLTAIPFDSTDPIIYAYQTGRYSSTATPREGFWRNIITCPLNTRNRTLGTLSVINRRSGAFGDPQIDLARAIASQIATSMENANLFAAERQRADLMALVNHISQELTATLSMSELTRKVVRAIHEQLGYETVNTYLLDEGGTRLVASSSVSSLPDGGVSEGTSISITQGIVGRAVRNGETQVIADISEDYDYMAAPSAAPSEMAAGSALVVPLRYSTRTLGAIEVLIPRPNGFRVADCLAMETLAAQVSIAIENARLWDQARRRLLEQGIVHQISRDLSAILDYRELTNAIVKHMCRALDTALCLLITYDHEAARLMVEAEYRLPELMGSGPSFISQPLSQAQRTAIERAIHTRRQTITTYSTQSIGGVTAAPYGQLTLPIVAGDRVIGCMVWIETRRQRDYTASDVRLAQTLTTQATIAIENARLFRQAQRQAHEQTLLRRVAAELSNQPDIDTAFEQLAQEIVLALDGINNVSLAIRTREGRLNLRACYLTTYQLTDTLLSYLLADNAAVAALLSMVEGGAVRAVNAPGSPLAPYIARYPLRTSTSILLLPIMRRKELIGVIEAASDNPTRIFDNQEVQLLEALANQGAIAYDNISLHLREQRRLRQLEQLQISSRKISGQLNTDMLYATIVREAQATFDVPAAALMLSSPDGYHTIRAAVGLSEQYVKNRRIRISNPDQIFVLSVAQAIEHEEAEQEALVRAERWSQALIVPLRKAGEILGLLNLYLTDPIRDFADEEKELASLFAAQAAVALENAKLFERLEDRAVELAQANKLKSEFLARVSHELRTPMNSINGYSEMLLKKTYGDLTERQSDRIERIFRNGRNLLALIDDLLDLSKIDAGKMELKIEACNVYDELESALNAMESQATARGLYLRLDVPQGIPPVQADSKRLRQILINLLGNAVKFTKQGGITLRAALHPDDPRPMVWISVADTGIGISKENQSIIFDEFRQADGSITREYGGTGLGLAISKKLVDMMGGTIWVQSEVGVGSVFTFTLPIDAE